MTYRIEIWLYGRWDLHNIETDLYFVIEEFSRLTKCGFTVRVQECRDMNSGKDWIG
jgi:hypothetical protein